MCFKPTPEIYCGYLRGRIANYEGYHYEHVASYEAPAVIGGDTIALDGLFLAKPDYIESKGVGATMFLQFHATEVNLVIESPEQSAEVEVTLNGSALPDNYRGTDLADIATVNVHEPAMYNLVKSDEPVQGIMAVRAKRGSFRAYAFTFSGCAPTKPRNATDELS
ncbi:MAG: hypothetical protein BWY68_00930 [bacterium ADurb.Bin400]|nr:MAG: hypothetical protein BWY68_00930 [bacterium ADurb.Bin400]